MSDVNVKIKGDVSHLKGSVDSAKGVFGSFTKDVSANMVHMAGHLFAAGAALEAIKIGYEAIKESAEWAHQTTLVAERLSIAKTAVLEYNLAAKRAGMESGEWAGSVEKVSKALVKADKDPALVDTLMRLGVSLQTIKDQDGQAAFEQIGAGLQKIPASAQRTTDLLEILGKKGGSLVNMMKGLADAKKDQDSLLHFTSEHDIEMLNEYYEIMESVGDGTKTATRELTSMGLRLVELVIPLREFAREFHMLGEFKGNPQQLKDLERMEKELEAKKKEVHPEESEQDKAEREKKDTKDRLDLEKQIASEKAKISEQISRQTEQNHLAAMTDKERLAYLDDQLAKASAQVDEVNRLKQSSAEWNEGDMKAMLMKAQLEGETYQLRRKLQTEDLRNLAKKSNMGSVSAQEQIGNYANSNLQDKLGSLNEQMLQRLVAIEKNTRPGNQSAPNIFTT